MIDGANVKLADGVAISMGDGVFVLTQDSDNGPQDVVVTADDLRAMLATIEA